QNSELRTQNSELRTQNSELRTQNSELRTQNSVEEIYSQTINLSGVRKPARNFSTGGISCWLFFVFNPRFGEKSI
ncbi:MAG: hypothetical protein IKA80_02690, partial [Spirochaetaceae bacterium]|nr:hypothetical protein [Spirochaetaceae bacterium]